MWGVRVSSQIPPTEQVSLRSAGLDALATPALVELLVADHREAVDAVLSKRDAIARAVDEIAGRLTRGGVLHYVGAGTSGRLAALDAAEMPPTFGTPPELVRAHVAGGAKALTRAIEGAEDDAAAGAGAMRRCGSSDAVVGLSASGGAAFVVGALERARQCGAYTLALTSVDESAVTRAAANAIVFETGAEALAGSTRLKAGTAQKIALNALSTAVMVRLEKVYDNLMVDVVAVNAKLRARAVRLVGALTGVDESRARALLGDSNGSVKVAVVMARRDVDAGTAREMLDRSGGSLRSVL